MRKECSSDVGLKYEMKLNKSICLECERTHTLSKIHVPKQNHILMAYTIGTNKKKIHIRIEMNIEAQNSVWLNLRMPTANVASTLGLNTQFSFVLLSFSAVLFLSFQRHSIGAWNQSPFSFAGHPHSMAQLGVVVCLCALFHIRIWIIYAIFYSWIFPPLLSCVYAMRLLRTVLI